MTRADISVVMLTANFFPYVGGAEKQALELSRFLKISGVRPLVLTRRLPGTLPSEEVSGISVRRLFNLGSGAVNSVSFMLTSFLYLLTHWREYDVIHVHLASSPAITACIIGKLLGKKVVVKLGGGRGLGEISLSKKNFLGRLKLRLLSMFSPQILAVNGDLLNELQESGFSKASSRLFANSVDTQTFAPAPHHEKLAAKKMLSVPQESVLFLFAGRLVPEKRLREFLEVWSEIAVPANRPFGAHFIIVGGGPEEKVLKETINALKLTRIVTLSGEKTDLLPYYHAADVFVLPSISEGLSNSMLEAMSSGLAVIASRVGGSMEAVAEGRSGFLFDPADRQEIKETIKRFFMDKGLARSMGEQSRQIALGRYSMSKAVEELIKIYKGVPH